MRIKNSLWIFFFSLISFSLYAQQATLKGRIVDARGQNIREIADVFINTGQLKQRLKSNPDGTFTVTIPARRVVTCIVEVNGNHEDRHTLKLQPGQAYTVVIKLGLTSPSAPLATAPPPTTTAPKTERAAPALRPTHERATASVPDKVSVPDKPVPSVGIMEQAEALISGSITDAAGGR